MPTELGSGSLKCIQLIARGLSGGRSSAQSLEPDSQFNAALPRQGRVIRACRRALIARDGLVSMRELRSWAYPGQPRQRWHRWSIVRALVRLGAKRIGWGIYATR